MAAPLWRCRGRLAASAGLKAVRRAAWLLYLGLAGLLALAGCRPTPGLREGQTAPPLKVADLAGRTYELGRLGGRVTLLAFLSEDNEESHDLTLAVSALRARHGPKGLRALGVWLGGSPESVRAFVRYKEVVHANAVLDGDDARRVAEEYGVRGVPTLFLMGTGRRVLASKVGYRPEDEGLLDRLVRDALRSQ